MFGSLLLTIYFLFLITYLSVIGFAVYRVFIFGKNKKLAGYSRKMSLAVVSVIAGIIFLTFLGIARYNWDDDLGTWIRIVFPSTKEKKEEIVKKEKTESKKKIEESKKEERAQKTDSGREEKPSLEKEYNKMVLKLFGLDRFIKIE